MQEMFPFLEAIARHESGVGIDTQAFADDLRCHTRRRIHTLIQDLPRAHNHRHDLAVLDMDGTLYPLDGEDNGFHNSTKQKYLTDAFLGFIRSRERNTDPTAASAIFEEALQHPIGPSVFLAKRYQVPRESVFPPIWKKLDTKQIVGNLNYEPRDVLRQIRERVAGILLLTAAPEVWEKRVLTQLGLSADDFDTVMTTEEFTTKADVFAAIRAARPSLRAISAGDSVSSDIEPARVLGFDVIHMNKSTRFNDIPRILDTMKA